MDKLIFTTSWDDGHPLDLKLAKLLKKYDIPATFYIPIDSVEKKTMTPSQIRTISKHFDVGGHTYHHLDLTKLSEEKAFWEISEGKDELERITGKRVDSFCYPGGFFNKKTKSMVKEAGFEQARTIRMLEYKQPYDILSTGTTILTGCNSRGHFHHGFKKRSIRNLHLPLWLLYKRSFKGWIDMSIKSLEFIKKKGGIFHLWGHSWEIEEKGCWHELETLFKRISGMDNLLKITNSELAKLK